MTDAAVSTDLKTIPVVWTNDDITFGKSAELRRMLAFLDERKIPGVFFLIPHNRSPDACGDLDQDRELLGVIAKAKERGHEFHQHGYEHLPYECGVPELRMLDFSEEERNRFDEERDALEEMHTFESQIRTLEKGRAIWRRAFGEDPVGFRPPWGAYCGNLYKALAALGFAWTSDRIPCFTGWEWLSGNWDAPFHIREKISTAPYMLRQGLMQFPMAGDYEIKVPNDPEKIERVIALGMREFDEFSRRGHPLLHCSHWHGLQSPGNRGPTIAHLPPHPTGTGYLVHDRLLAAQRASGRAEFIGMKELATRYH
ncbi:MAG: DUF2334 domain-containing protein [Planctomycetota bacterium]